MTRKTIHKFELEGTSKDVETIVRKREEWTRYLVMDLRDKGYVPVLDIDPHVDISYDEDHEIFDFNIVVQAVYIGKKKSWEVEGIAGNEEIPRRTVTSKQKQ